MTSQLAPDWILQQALEAQKQANSAWVNGKPELDDGGLTMTVIGCGTIGTAILKGILQCVEFDSLGTGGSAATYQARRERPQKLPSKFHACVRRSESAKRVKTELGKYNARLKVFENDNIEAVKDADIIFLCCRPQTVAGILQVEGIRESLAGKVLISTCAGISETKIHNVLYQASDQDPSRECVIVRALPNIASSIRESMTIISSPIPPVSVDTQNLITWLFERLGQVLYVPESAMDACTALCCSGPAFIALIIESMANGVISMGLPREEAYMIAAQTLRGTSGLLLEGEHPAILRDKASTPGGCTFDGLQFLEEACLRGTVRKAVQETAISATKLARSRIDDA